jgi:alpha-L-fucosidase
MGRPNYKEPQPEYLWEKDEDSKHYIDFVHGQLRELLTNYGDLAGIWFDPIMGYYARPDLFPIHDTYALVRKLQPHALISFKQGATGTEDFATPERHGRSLEENVRRQFGDENAKIARQAWASNKPKRNEICDTLQPGAWGCKFGDDGNHKKPDELRRLLGEAFGENCGLLMNTGPLPDGSIHKEDVATLRESGRIIRRDGYPEPIDR